MVPRAWIVVDLGFGDAGKGAITDALVRHTKATWVVRYNGGAQAGHNVITEDGRHHTFSQFGSGSFVPGVHSYLAPKVIVHPSALLFEEERLVGVGVHDALERLRIARECRVTTPFHQAAGRIRELLRGEDVHGTCGVGVGETVRDAIEYNDDVLCAGSLQESRESLLSTLERIRRRLLASLPPLPNHVTCRAEEEWELLRDPDVSRRWLQLIEPIRADAHIVADKQMHSQLTAHNDIILEGAQGILLDEWYGFHPHTTWSTCTSEWAQQWIRGTKLPHTPVRLGILRTYATRHGQGPLPSEEPTLLPLLPERHNDNHQWQGRFRVGWPDPVLARYAIAANGGIDALALTHLDSLQSVSKWQYVKAHPGVDLDVARMPRKDLSHQEQLGRSLEESVPVLDNLPASGESEYLGWLETSLGARVLLASHGPTSGDAHFCFDPSLLT